MLLARLGGRASSRQCFISGKYTKQKHIKGSTDASERHQALVAVKEALLSHASALTWRMGAVNHCEQALGPRSATIGWFVGILVCACQRNPCLPHVPSVFFGGLYCPEGHA
jgi:hypothetical protein